MEQVRIHPRYLVDEQGNRVAVVLDVQELHRLLEEFEQLAERQEMLSYNPARDPGAGLQLREDVIEDLKRQMETVAKGERGKSLDEVARELGL